MGYKRGSIVRLSLLACALVMGLGGLRSENAGPYRGPLEDFDSRIATTAYENLAQVSPAKDRLELLKWNADGDLIYRPNALNGTPHHLFSYDKRLTAPSQRPPREIAIDFLRENAEIFRLTPEELNDLVLEQEYVTKHNQITHLFFQQYYKGIAVFHGELRVHVDKYGQILAVGGDVHPGINLPIEPKISAHEAIRLAAVNTKILSDTAKDAQLPEAVAQDTAAQLTLFPVASGGRLAWKVMLYEEPRGDHYEVLVDAQDGQVLFRYNLTRYDGPSGYVFDKSSPQPTSTPGIVPPSPNPPPIVARVLKSFAGDETASPRGWVYDAETAGNNVIARVNRAGLTSLTAGQTARMTNNLFDHPLELGSGARGPQNFADAAVTNLFYWCNVMHDYYFKLGFDEAAGNFQAENFQPPPNGKANDPVIAFAQFGMDRLPPVQGKSSFTATPDGQSPTLRISVWNSAVPVIDGSFDAEIIVHEYTHGLSSRLVGRGNNVSCLAGSQGGALSEGWSDFLALSVLTPKEGELHGLYPFGSYVAQNFSRGVRTRPYSSRMGEGNVLVNPLTYANLGKVIGRPEVHADGEIWAQTLWELRSKLIEQYGFEIGKRRVEQLIIDAMKLAPCSPSMVDIRDAILIADSVDYGFQDQNILWQVFAKRGLGVQAFGGDSRTIDVTPNFSESSNTAQISLSEDVYYPGQSIVILVTDSNFHGDALPVTVTSDSGDSEIVTLRRTALGQTRGGNSFRGSIRSSANPVSQGNGSLEVRAGGTITATYHNTAAPDSEGRNVRATAVVRNPYNLSVVPNGFRAVGTPQNLNSERATRQFTLPFPFPLFNRVYKAIYVSPKGLINLANADSSAQNSSSELAKKVAIAPLWADLRTNGRAQAEEDIYTSATEDSFTVRWAGEVRLQQGSGSPVNFSATLFRDGRIRFDYGAGNAALPNPTVGISSGSDFFQVAASHSGRAFLGNAETLIFSPTGESSLPVIESIEPTVVGPGEVQAVIRGARLEMATGIGFSGKGVSAVLRGVGTDTLLPVTITISTRAEATPRTLWVYTPRGVGFGPAVLEVLHKPMILSINPAKGSVGQGVEINGVNFSSTFRFNTVEFVQGGRRVPANVLANDSSRLVVAVPRELSPGPAALVVKTNNVESFAVGFTIVASPEAPWLAALSPAEGVPGEAVNVSGLGLASSSTNGGSNKVWFTQGGRTIEANVLARNNVSSVAAEVPKGLEAGEAQVLVQAQFNPGGVLMSSPLSNALMFKVLASPKPPALGSVPGQAIAQGRGAAGQMVALSGVGFHPTIPGNNALTITEVNSGKQFKTTATATRADGRLIAFTMPPNIAPGRVEISPQVRFNGSNSGEGDRLFGKFLLTADPRPPVITSISQAAGARRGQVITINGNGFSADPVSNTVIFRQGATAIPGTVLGASGLLNSLSVMVPRELEAGPVFVESSVIAGCRESRRGAGLTYNILAPPVAAPRVNALSPPRGKAGDRIIVRGSNFVSRFPDANIVRFGEIAATVLEAQGNTLSVIVPYTLTPGTTGVTVEVAGQRSNPMSFVNTAPIRPPRTLHFAQFADGNSLNSTLTLFNPSFTETATVEASLQSSENGAPLIINLNGRRVVGQTGFSIPPLSLVALVSDGCASRLQAGSVKVTSNQPLAGTVLFSMHGIGAAGVGESLPTTRLIAPIEKSTKKNLNTGLAITNASATAVEVNATLRDETGRERASTRFNLPLNGQKALFINELFGSVDLSDFRGSLLVTAPTPVAATALRLTSRSLSTLPVATDGQSSKNLYFAHMAKGAGITSTILLVNPSETSAVRGSVRLLNQYGGPMTLAINGRPFSGGFAFSLPPRGVGMYSTDGSLLDTPLEVGSAQITAENDISGTVLFDVEGGGSVGVGSSQPTTQFLAPLERKISDGTDTGLAIANTQPIPVTVQLQLLNEKGELVGATSLPLPPQGQTARFLSELFSDADINDFRGLVIATASTRDALVGTVLRVTASDLSTLPVTPTGGN